MLYLIKRFGIIRKIDGKLFKPSKTRLIAAIPLLLYLVNPIKKEISLKLALLVFIWSLLLLAVDLLFRNNEKYNIIGYVIIAVIFIAIYFIL